MATAAKKSRSKGKGSKWPTPPNASTTSERRLILAHLRESILAVPEFTADWMRLDSETTKVRRTEIVAASGRLERAVRPVIEILALLTQVFVPDAFVPAPCQWFRRQRDAVGMPVLSYLGCSELCVLCREEALKQLDMIEKGIAQGGPCGPFLPIHVYRTRHMLARELRVTERQAKRAAARESRKSHSSLQTRLQRMLTTRSTPPSIASLVAEGLQTGDYTRSKELFKKIREAAGGEFPSSDEYIRRALMAARVPQEKRGRETYWNTHMAVSAYCEAAKKQPKQGAEQD